MRGTSKRSGGGEGSRRPPGGFPLPPPTILRRSSEAQSSTKLVGGHTGVALTGAVEHGRRVAGGCALNIVFSPQRSAGQARYLREEGCQFPVQDEPHAANACGRHLKALSSEEEAHRLRVTMIRPERNMPEVPRPSVRVYCIVSFNFRWREEAAHQGCRETMCLVCCMAPRERRRGGHLSVLTSLAVGDQSTLTRPP